MARFEAPCARSTWPCVVSFSSACQWLRTPPTHRATRLGRECNTVDSSLTSMVHLSVNDLCAPPRPPCHCISFGPSRRIRGIAFVESVVRLTLAKCSYMRGCMKTRRAWMPYPSESPFFLRGLLHLQKVSKKLKKEVIVNAN